MDETSRKAIEKRKTSKAWKWAATGAGLVVGGVAIGLTGGLAAPVLAPLLVGASAGTLGFLATSGGAILLGTLFGVAGGGLTAFRARRRIQGIDEFEFHQIVDDPELPQIPSLHATIVCTGFMTKENDYIDPWRPTCNHTLDRRDVYALKTESAAFLSAGKDLDTYVRDYVLMKGATEVVKRTALAAFYTAVALPAAIYKSAGTVLDNQFIRTRDKANKAGILLADVLEQRVQGARPTTLIGAGLGAVIVFRALIELHSRGLAHLLFDVILISAPLSPSPAEWAKARHVVSRRLVNAYSSNDYVLAIVVRLHSLVSTQLTLRVAGLQPVGIDGVEDVNVSEIVGGHMELLSKLDQPSLLAHELKSRFTLLARSLSGLPRSAPYAPFRARTPQRASFASSMASSVDRKRASASPDAKVSQDATLPAKKRRVVKDSSEEAEEPSSTNGKGKAKAVAAIFQPKAKASSTKAEEPTSASTSRSSPEQGSSEESEETDSEEEAQVEDESKERKQDKVQAVKLAEIFTKKKIGASTEIGGHNVLDWKAGDPVPYASLVKTFQLIEGTSKRLEISAFLSAYLLAVIQRSPEDLTRVVYLCINRLCPDYEGLELGIGEGLLQKAIAEATGRGLAQVKADYVKTGDLGLVAQSSRKVQPTMFKQKPLDVRVVFKNLKDIAAASGQNSQAKKTGIIKKLLAGCEGSEAKFVIRSLEGKLRIGLAERTVLIALATAVVRHEIEQSGKKISQAALEQRIEAGQDMIKQVFSELPSYDKIVPALLEQGIDKLHDVCALTAGIPLKPMLAKPTKAITEVLDRFEGQDFTCEYKYDGERAQVHMLEDGSIKVFSRNSEDMSIKYPDLVEQLPRCIKPSVKSFVIDAECTAWSKDEKRLLPFQELSKRKRKGVKIEDVTVRVKLFAFDLLYLNGETLLKTDLDSRRKLLREHFSPVANEFDFATSADASDVEHIQAFLDESIKQGCEGLMVKMLHGQGAYYEPSRRSMNWLKVKKDYLQGVGDSFDLTVIGGYHGRGKRTAVYGAFLLACYDPDSESYQAVCKLGTGFSEEALDSHYTVLKPHECGKRGYYEVGTATPDVYFEPRVVWEVLAADLSLSPVYTAAREQLGGERGVSLRFPRFIRIRDDKGVEDSTTPEFIAEAYQRQAVTVNGKRKTADEDLY
ncbi:hypothetical protein E5Q_02023.2 [Mixia osmundae IAM 14324]|nr:hypothetical protein E5Q_02023.2 [Mixia osmundae IAM 14324]